MSNFEEIKRKAQDAAYTAIEKAQDAAAAAGEKAGAIRDAAKTGVSLVTERRSLEKSYQALGEWFAAQCGEDAPEGAEDLIRAVRASQQRIEVLKAARSEQELSARELLDRGVEFFAEKAEAIASLAKKPADGTRAHELVEEGVEIFAEKAEELAEEAAAPADIKTVHELVEEGVETFAEKAEELAEEAAAPADIKTVHELVEEGIETAADFVSGGEKAE